MKQIGMLTVYPVIRENLYTGDVLQDGMALDKSKVIGVAMNETHSTDSYSPTAGLKIADATKLRVTVSDKRSTPFIDTTPSQLFFSGNFKTNSEGQVNFVPIVKGSFNSIQLFFSADGTPPATNTCYPVTLFYEID